MRKALSSKRLGARRGAILAALVGIVAPVAARAQPAPAPTEAAPREAAPDQAPDEPEPGGAEERAAPAPTPTAPSRFEGIEVLVIKGRQHEDLLADTSVSGMTFDASELSNLRIQDISDLAEFSPNVDIKTRSAASNPTLFIRGIGLKDYNANAAGAVAIYQDGININSPAIQLFQLFDVDTVEVLLGPQGSLTGRNATAGAIRVTSVLPDGEFGGTASFTYGNYDTLEGEGALNLPLVEDVLSARFAFTASFADGNTDNECANWNPESVGSPRLTQQTITDSWIAAGRPTAPRFYPTQNSVDPLGRPLQPDSVCIWESQGRLDTLPVRQNPNAQPIWQPPAPGIRTVDDFQGLSKRVNDVHNWAGRGILRYEPLEDMEWVLNGHGGRNRSGSRHLQMLKSRFLVDSNALAESIDGFSEVNAGENSGLEGSQVVDGFYSAQQVSPPVPGGRRGQDPFSGWYDEDGGEFLDTWGTNLRGRWDLGNVVVSTLTGYDWYDRLVEDEGDATPELVLAGDYSDSAWQVSEELRAEGDGDRYRWTVGGFVLYEKLTAFNFFPGTLQFRIDQNFDQELLSFAPYAGASYDFTEELGIEAGIRYNVEKKKFTLSSSAVGTSSGAQSQEIPEQTVKETWTGPTGDLTLNYTPYWDLLDRLPNDSLRLYSKYSRGMKGGHFNAGLTVRAGVAAQSISPVEPEFIHAAEIGLKSSWWDGRLTLRGALFRYWYKDLQVFDFVNEAGSLPTQQLLNSDARVLGAELELLARPIPELTTQLGFGWLDSQFEDFSVTKAVSLGPRGDPNQATFDYSGNPLISAPRFSLSGVVDYEIPLGGFGTLIPQYSFSYSSKTNFDPTGLDPISQPPYWLHNARLTYRTPDARIEIAGWVENFTDTFYKVDTFDLTLGFEEILEVWGDPRIYGITVTYNW